MTDNAWFEEFCAELGDSRVRFWRCPVKEHRGGPLRVEVEWRDGIAHCTWPGCGRSSAKAIEHVVPKSEGSVARVTMPATTKVTYEIASEEAP